MRFIVFIIIIAAALFCGRCDMLAAGSKKLTFQQAYLNQGESLLNTLPQIEGWRDDSNYYLYGDNELLKVNVKTGKAHPVLDAGTVSVAYSSGFDLSDSFDRTGDFEKHVFIRSGEIYLYEKKTNGIKQITLTPQVEENPAVSPDATMIAYTLGGDLYVYDLAGGKSKRITHDGGADILNGYASWVYYEEILGRSSNYKAFWWSPDSRQVAYMRFDQSRVPVFPIVASTGTYSTVEEQRYPKPGYPNPEVQLYIAEIKTGHIQQVPQQDTNDHYLAHPTWHRNRKSGVVSLYFQWLNRKQNHLKVLRYTPVEATSQSPGAVETVYGETQRTWVRFFKTPDIKILANGALIIRSSQSGWFHLYYVPTTGKKNRPRQLTAGNWSVNSIARVIQSKQVIFFMAQKESTLENHLYRINYSGKKMKRLTIRKGTHNVRVSPGGSYFIDEYSSVDYPVRMEIRNSRGKLLRKLGDSYSAELENYQLPKKELFKITTRDGYSLPAYWILPPGFSKNKKYPVVFFVYGGPGRTGVMNEYPGSFAPHYLARQGIIYFVVDHRGSGHFGKKGADLMYRNLGKWEMFDYIEAVTYLRSLPFVDGDKIGITGSSYGGYLTTMALSYASGYFQYGVADASVLDWKLYDSIYTERYMGTPEENPQGYENASTFTYIHKYKSDTLRMTHGTIDDNVHMQNTIQYIDKILDAGKTLEFMLYPGERHTLGKKRAVRNKATINFWLKKFFPHKNPTEH
ncbi:MAG: prolyl oligopeptidase family serine peptidase [bacterium]|nr:prolyl oligopeptidase family serine peptidase [bacterium]